MTTATQYRRRKLDDFNRFRGEARFWRAAALGVGLLLIFVAALLTFLIPDWWSFGSAVVLAIIWLLFLEYGYIHFRCPVCESVVGDNRGIRFASKCPTCRTRLE